MTITYAGQLAHIQIEGDEKEGFYVVVYAQNGSGQPFELACFACQTYQEAEKIFNSLASGEEE